MVLWKKKKQMFTNFNWCIEKRNFETLNLKTILLLLQKISSREILIIVLKVREISVISEAKWEITVFVRGGG